MKIGVAMGLAFGLYGRGFGYLWTAYNMLKQFRADGETKFLIGGSIACVTMGLFNCALLFDSVQEAIKFLPMSFEKHDKETLHRQGTRTLHALSTGAPRLPSSRKYWGRVRGAVLMGT